MRNRKLLANYKTNSQVNMLKGFYKIIRQNNVVQMEAKIKPCRPEKNKPNIQKPTKVYSFLIVIRNKHFNLSKFSTAFKQMSI